MYNIEILKDFFDYEDSFWNFVSDKTFILPEDEVEPEALSGVIIKTNDLNEIINIKIIVPKMTNKQNILINIHEFTHAHDLYLILGNPMNMSDEEYELRAKNEEKRYIKKHL